MSCRCHRRSRPTPTRTERPHPKPPRSWRRPFWAWWRTVSRRECSPPFGVRYPRSNPWADKDGGRSRRVLSGSRSQGKRQPDSSQCVRPCRYIDAPPQLNGCPSSKTPSRPEPGRRRDRPNARQHNPDKCHAPSLDPIAFDRAALAFATARDRPRIPPIASRSCDLRRRSAPLAEGQLVGAVPHVEIVRQDDPSASPDLQTTATTPQTNRKPPSVPPQRFIAGEYPKTAINYNCSTKTLSDPKLPGWFDSTDVGRDSGGWLCREPLLGRR